MVKATLILLVALLLCGCQGVVKVKTETQDVFIPVTYCPAPPTVERPVLPIETITPQQAQQDGEVAKHFKATIKALMDYSELLESVVAEYANINKLSEDIRSQIEKKRKELEEAKARTPQ